MSQRVPTAAWPPLPATADGVLGAIRVRRMPGVFRRDGARVEGFWNPGRRLIEVARQPDRANEWFNYFHEWTHAVLDDLRSPLTMEQRETVCDAIALARVREMAKQLGL